MTIAERVEILEQKFIQLEKIIKSDCICLTDENDSNKTLLISFKQETYSVDRITTSQNQTIENITNETL